MQSLDTAWIDWLLNSWLFWGWRLMPVQCTKKMLFFQSLSRNEALWSNFVSRTYEMPRHRQCNYVWDGALAKFEWVALDNLSPFVANQHIPDEEEVWVLCVVYNPQNHHTGNGFPQKEVSDIGILNEALICTQGTLNSKWTRLSLGLRSILIDSNKRMLRLQWKRLTPGFGHASIMYNFGGPYYRCKWYLPTSPPILRDNQPNPRYTFSIWNINEFAHNELTSKGVGHSCGVYEWVLKLFLVPVPCGGFSITSLRSKLSDSYAASLCRQSRLLGDVVQMWFHQQSWNDW